MPFCENHSCENIKRLGLENNYCHECPHNYKCNREKGAPELPFRERALEELGY